ncbi:MAG: hypothetical protein ACKVS9_08010 [Phycisphaerae bacterium]
MKCINGTLIGMSVFASSAIAQTVTPVTDTTDTPTSLVDRTPSENARGGAVRERAPGNLISAARTRHTELAADRRERQTSGNTGDGQTPEENGNSGGSSGGGIGDLLGGALDSGLLDTLLGGGGLNGLLGGGTTGTTSGGTGNLTPEAIQMLTDAGFNVGDFNLKQRDAASDATTVAKLGSRQQTIPGLPTEEEEPFRIRWSDAMLSTIFTSLVFAFQTPDFISFLEDLIRPIIRPDLTGDDSSRKTNDAANPRRRAALDGNMRLVFKMANC